MRAAYFHKAEHLDERRLMLQWWADFLDANRRKVVSPFDFFRLSNEHYLDSRWEQYSNTWIDCAFTC